MGSHVSGSVGVCKQAMTWSANKVVFSPHMQPSRRKMKGFSGIFMPSQSDYRCLQPSVYAFMSVCWLNDPCVCVPAWVWERRHKMVSASPILWKPSWLFRGSVTGWQPLDISLRQADITWLSMLQADPPAMTSCLFTHFLSCLWSVWTMAKGRLPAVKY